MRIPFVKMHGLGNDFVVLDERRAEYGLSAPQLAALADRRLGIGCDQVLSLRATTAQAAAGYRVFNADGSSAEHCGNGVRCIARYLEQRGEVEGGSVAVEIDGEVFELALRDDGLVEVDMGCPRFEPADIPLAVAERADRYRAVIDDTSVEFGAVSVGNPHATVPVADVYAAPVEAVGAALQADALFPQSVNVGFMQTLDRGRIRLRVYERGAGETRACGTGACAAVAIGRRWNALDEHVVVSLRGGELRISWSGEAGARIRMTGPAAFVFEGTIEL